jgi:hypothetical protein
MTTGFKPVSGENFTCLPRAAVLRRGGGNHGGLSPVDSGAWASSPALPGFPYPESP